MKIVITPLIENDANYNYFTPTYTFESEWCLDLHGFLSREEFAARLNEINNHIRDYPLLSERARKLLLYVYAALIILATIIILSFAITAGVISSGASITSGTIITIGYFAGKYIVERIATRRTEKFSEVLNSLFNEYNKRENPTANWRLAWRSVITEYKITLQSDKDGKSIGKAKPKYAEQAEIMLEINDALSDLTASTVRVNLASAEVINASSIYASRQVTKMA